MTGPNLPEDIRPPSQEDVRRMLSEHLEEQGEDVAELKFDFGTAEEMLVFGLAGGFLHNLDYVDDPIFYMGPNAMLGLDEDEVPEEARICKKIPLTISGYGLLDSKGELTGFACFASQLKENS